MKCKGNPELKGCDGFFGGGGWRITIPPPVCRKTISRSLASGRTAANALIGRQNLPESASAGSGHFS
jgi:hypothetical protein